MSETKSPGKTTKGLGRGLGSLLGSTGEGAFARTAPGGDKALESLTAKFAVEAPEAIRDGFVEPVKPANESAPLAPTVPPHTRVWNLSIENVFPNANQPRQIFDKEPLEELANSIREKGIIQPLLVRKSPDGEYEIIAGERRWRAAQLAGLKSVPALVRESSEQEVSELALIENIQREDLNAIEEAEAYDFLIKKYHLTQAELAQKVGKDRATVANMLRILQLPLGIRQMVSAGEISLGQAKVLLSVGEPKMMTRIAERARAEGMSVRALEKLIAKTKRGEPLPTAQEDARTKAALALREELQRLLGSKVQLDYEDGKGKITVHFYSDSELNQLADTLRDAWRN